jgi:hypothetical protein
VRVRECPVRGEKENRVVDRAAVTLVHADDEPHARVACDSADPLRLGARHDDGLVGDVIGFALALGGQSNGG